LLIEQVPVCRDKNVESALGCRKKLAVSQPRPAQLVRSFYLMFGEVLPERDWRTLIEQDSHPDRVSRSLNAASCVLEDGVNLLARGTGKEAGQLLEKLGPEGDARILQNLIILPKIDYQAEEILSLIARRAPEGVIDFFCKRIADDSQEREYAGAEAFEAVPFEFDKLREPLSGIPGYAVRRVYELYKADSDVFEFRGARLLRNIFPSFSDAFEAELLQLLKGGDETQLRFVVGILRAYQGQSFIHRLCKEIVKAVSEESPIVNEVGIALETTGVVSGTFGMAEAYERKKQEVLEWLTDPNERVREFAKRYISDLEKVREGGMKRAEEGIALRKHHYGED
jgi:hypothetical protein